MAPQRDPAELAILRRYAGGADLREIGEALSVPHARVVAAVEAVGFVRTRAAARIRDHEAGQRRPPAAPTPAVAAATPPKPARTPAPAAPPPPSKEPTVPPAADLQLQPQPDTIEQRLLRAEAIPRLKTKAARIRGMLDDLGRDLETAAQAVEAERKVERLRVELASAVKELRQMTRPTSKTTAAPAPAPAPGDGPNPRDVRAWAARNGIACQPHGRVPGPVLEQYLAAHPKELTK